MVYKHLINKTEFVIHVHKNGGRTNVYKDRALYFSGQYFPLMRVLKTPNFVFEGIRQRIEDSINTKIKPQDIIFPYYKKPSQF